MNIRTALVVAFVSLAGCNSWPGGKSTVPPPGTGAVVAPNPYYTQPSATPPAFTPPTYGAPGGAAATAPGFGAAARPNVSLASNSQTPVFRPVTKQPTLTANSATSTINPRTTLTASHSPTTGGLPDLTGLPVVPVPGAPQPTTAPRTTFTPNSAYPPATAPLMAPSFKSPPPRASGVRDPWRGR